MTAMRMRTLPKPPDETEVVTEVTTAARGLIRAGHAAHLFVDACRAAEEKRKAATVALFLLATLELALWLALRLVAGLARLVVLLATLIGTVASRLTGSHGRRPATEVDEATATGPSAGRKAADAAWHAFDTFRRRRQARRTARHNARQLCACGHPVATHSADFGCWMCGCDTGREARAIEPARRVLALPPAPSSTTTDTPADTTANAS